MKDRVYCDSAEIRPTVGGQLPVFVLCSVQRKEIHSLRRCVVAV